MEFNINVIQVEKHTKSAKNGNAYVQLEVAYKDLSQNKVGSKKIMPFGNTQSVHKVLADAKGGDIFTVKTEKNPEGYWDWIDIKQSAPGTTVAPTPSPKSTYETPEERAKKQVYIVKQSSLASAIQLLSVGAKAPPDPVAVLSAAQKFTDWVFSNEPVSSLANMNDDLPE